MMISSWRSRVSTRRPLRPAAFSCSSWLTRSTRLKNRHRARVRMTAEATPMHRWVFPVPVPPMKIAVPRDRAGSFEPQLIPKGQTRFEGFDDKISSLHARGMTVREIQGHLIEIHGIDVSPDLISRVTDSVLDEVHEWQGRPLDPVHPIVFLDASRVKIRAEGLVKNKAVHV